MSLPDTASGNGPPVPPPDPGSGCDVTLPSGAVMEVMNEAEADYVAVRVDRYETAYRLSDISDQQDLDQIVIGELLNQRYSAWLALGADYDGEAIDEARIRRDRLDNSRELRLLKKSLTIDKAARERNRGEGSVAHYLEQLLVRARQFGYHRNAQSARAMELINELIGLLTFSRNCSPEERIEFHVTSDDVLTWIWETLRVEYDALDADFRTRQGAWIREM